MSKDYQKLQFVRSTRSLKPGMLRVLIAGPASSGKTSLMGEIASHLSSLGAEVVCREGQSRSICKNHPPVASGFRWGDLKVDMQTSQTRYGGEMSADVEYRSIPGLPGYKAGSDGTIWSCWKIKNADGVTGYRKTKHWHQIKRSNIVSTARNCKTPRMYVTIKNSAASKGSEMRYCAELVLLAFTGPPPVGMTFAHKNSNTLDDTPGNLWWGRPLTKNGRSSTPRKVTDEMAKEITRRRAAGDSLRSLADEFEISKTHVSRIARGINRAHVPRDGQLAKRYDRGPKPTTPHTRNRNTRTWQ